MTRASTTPANGLSTSTSTTDESLGRFEANAKQTLCRYGTQIRRGNPFGGLAPLWLRVARIETWRVLYAPWRNRGLDPGFAGGAPNPGFGSHSISRRRIP